MIMEHINRDNFALELKSILVSCVGKDYARALTENEEFFNLVISDVEETSAWNDSDKRHRYYTDDDIRLAIGRAIMWKFGIDF